MHNIVILGSGFAALTIGHRLLKKTQPSHCSFKVTIIAPSTHIYWNIAAVRGILPNGHGLTDDQIFQPYVAGFRKYPQGAYEIILGIAKQVDESANEVVVDSLGKGVFSIHYDTLVVATGSSSLEESCWKLSNLGYEATLQSLSDMRRKVEAAKSIVIGGAGPTGVETAAELGAVYGLSGAKYITLISSDSKRILAPMRDDIALEAEKQLEAFGVKIVKGARVKGVSITNTDKTELDLSNGTTLVTDLYIPSSGVKANTEFLPKTLLDERGNLVVDENLRAKYAVNKNIYGAGDVTNLQTKQVSHAEAQALHLAANLDLLLKSKALQPYRPDDKVLMFVALSKSKGVAQMGGWRLPGFLAVMLKSNSLTTERTKAVALGEKLPMGGSM